MIKIILGVIIGNAIIAVFRKIVIPLIFIGIIMGILYCYGGV